jgi:hypothetical protein
MPRRSQTLLDMNCLVTVSITSGYCWWALARLSMVRRRSTVRFRNGAPGYRGFSNIGFQDQVTNQAIQLQLTAAAARRIQTPVLLWCAVIQTRFDGVRPLVTGNSRICPDSAAARLRCGENGLSTGSGLAMPARLASPASSSTTDPGYRGAAASGVTPRYAMRAFQHRDLLPQPPFRVRSQRLLADDRAPRQEQPGDASALAGVHDLGPDERLRARPHPARFHRVPPHTAGPPYICLHPG